LRAIAAASSARLRGALASIRRPIARAIDS
jgi:hypothetical protein